jgi:RsmE family RNA methyltransferase
MNLVLLQAADLSGDPSERIATLHGRRAKHVREVLRAVPGDTLAVGLEGDRIGRGVVVSVAPHEVVLSVRFTVPPPVPPGIDLLLALPRPKVLRRLLAAATSLGVKRIVLLNGARVEKSYFDSPLLDPAAMREDLLLGLEQARDTVVPELLVRKRFRPFVEDELASLWPAPTRRLLAHPTSTKPLEACDAGSLPVKCVVAIGPEGGWVPFETALLEQHGFEGFSLGERILRVDTAVPVIVAQLELARRLSGRGSPSPAPG